MDGRRGSECRIAWIDELYKCPSRLSIKSPSISLFDILSISFNSQVSAHTFNKPLFVLLCNCTLHRQHPNQIILQSPQPKCTISCLSLWPSSPSAAPVWAAPQRRASNSPTMASQTPAEPQPTNVREAMFSTRSQVTRLNWAMARSKTHTLRRRLVTPCSRSATSSMSPS